MGFLEKFERFYAEKRLNQEEFAERMNINRVTLSRLLNGKNLPSFEVLRNFARAFPEIDLDYFIRDDITEMNVPPPKSSFQVADEPYSADLLADIRVIERTLENMKERLSQY